MPERGTKLKILLVGDHLPERDALALVVADRGFFPRVASTFELVFAAAHEQPDILVFDAEHLGAEEVGRLLREAATGCPVLVLTDRDGSNLRVFQAECGADHCITRTDSPHALARAIERFASGAGQESQAPPPHPTPPERVDFVGLARRSTREQFVAAWPYPFLVSTSNLVSQAEVKNTADILDSDVLLAIQNAVTEAVQAPRKYVDTPRRSSAVALAIRGLTDPLSPRLVVGRARDVDVFIDHATISKHHAVFLSGPDGMRLADTGSRNGTWVGGRLLEPNGPPSSVVESEDSVRFGELEFTFLSPAAAWDVMRVNVR